jgi:hypothetical protein
LRLRRRNTVNPAAPAANTTLNPTAPTNRASDVHSTERPIGEVEQPGRRARPSAATQLTGQLGIFETQSPLDARKESTFTSVHPTTVQVRTAGSTNVNGATPIGEGMTLDFR